MIARKLLMLLLLFFLSGAISLNAQETPSATTNVYLDCNRCDQNYIKRELEIVNYVRDRTVADIHILVTDQRSGSGGRLYKVNFIGLQEAYDQNFTIDLSTYQTDAQVDVNQKLTNVIKAGLMPFLVTKAAVKMDVSVEQPPVGSNALTDDDPWNFWIFEVGGNFNWEKESNQSEYELEGAINIQRTTEQWRFRSEVETDYEVNHIKRGGESLTSSLKRSSARASIVKSLSPHWSAGFFGNVRSSTFTNIDLGSGIQAAAEFSFFPYRVSATKEFTIAYLVGPQYFNYREKTIFEKQTEQLFQQSLKAELNVRKPWGNIHARLRGSHFLHDFSKNRVEFNSRLSLQVIRGLFLRVGGRANLINDQIYLPKGDASLEEILLQRRALATSFELDVYFGIGYTFGSIYNSIVNTRL